MYCNRKIAAKKQKMFRLGAQNQIVAQSTALMFQNYNTMKGNNGNALQMR